MEKKNSAKVIIRCIIAEKKKKIRRHFNKSAFLQEFNLNVDI